jgi:hypothetical protein
MKIYKLIKKYPMHRYIVDNAIVEYNKKLNCYVYNNGTLIFSTTEVEEYPKFWEKVELPNQLLGVQVLSILYNNTIYTLTDNLVPLNHIYGFQYKYINGEEWMNLWNYYNISNTYAINDKIKIHSVKRISDGEVFTIGDSIDCRAYTNRMILGFKIINDTIEVEQINGESDLPSIRHSKKIKTIEGLEVTEIIFNEKIFSISEENTIIDGLYGLQRRYFSSIDEKPQWWMNLWNYNKIKNEYTLNPQIKIRTVKRISDGEVFTLGDKVRISKLNNDGSFIISEFYMDYNNIHLLCNGENTGNGNVSILKIEHKPKPIFITHDGVDIYEGDRYHSIVLSDLEYRGSYTCVMPNVGLYTNPDTCKTFSSKENALHYITMNKRCLSIHDLIYSDSGITYDKTRELIKIVNNRLS